jgi:hypothetical protein
MESEEFLNLSVRRSEAHVWKPRGWRQRYLDDGTVLRLVSIAGAGLLLYGAYAARRQTTSSLWWVVCGASLLGCAAAGRHSLGRLRSDQGLADPDVVTQESLDSFPASDAPSSNATTATPRSL